MIIRLHPDADPAAVSGRLAALGLWVDRYDGGDGLPVFAVHPCSTEATREEIAAIDGVAAVLSRPNGTPRLDALPAVLDVAGVSFGTGQRPVLMAGPCSVESEEQIDAIAR
ncbi:MAG: synthetase family, partial [Acidobacteria bacterium]|nr:synthetase family [Acidobacteriota bacterium]